MAEEEQKQEECPAGSPLWMCTFADLMSLLLCFFVLLLSFSVMDAQKYKEVSGSMKEAFGVQREMRVTGSPHGQRIIATEFLSTPMAVKIQDDIDEVIAEAVKSGMVETELLYNGILVRMKDSVGFEFGKATLRPKFKKILEKIGKVLAETEATVLVSGHTDNVPLKKGSSAFSSNWSLSTTRAVAVVEYWSKKFKLPADRMSAAGYADGQPLKANKTAEGRAANRRVEFRIQASEKSHSFKGLRELLIDKDTSTEN